MGKSPISMVIFKSKLLVYQRVYKLGTLLSMASKWHQNSLLWKFLSTARPNVTIIPNYRNNFLVLELGMIPNYLLPFQIINYHHTTYDHSFVYYHIWCIYIYICINHVHSCTYIYIYPYVTIIHSPFFCPSVTVTSRSVPPLRFQKHRDPPHPLIARIPPAQVFPWSCDWHAKGGKLLIHWFSKIGKKD